MKSKHATRDYKLAAIDDTAADQRTFYHEQANPNPLAWLGG